MNHCIIQTWKITTISETTGEKVALTYIWCHNVCKGFTNAFPVSEQEEIKSGAVIVGNRRWEIDVDEITGPVAIRDTFL